MDVILINFPGLRFPYVSSGILPPLGLAYIASFLEREKYKVKIVDLTVIKVNERLIKELICSNKADIYGLSSTLFSLQESLRLAKIIKLYKPNSKVILGGLCTVFSPEIILKKSPEIDIVVRGEGEHSMLELCRVFRNNMNLRDVKGITFRNNEEIISTPLRPWIENLDNNLFPARHLMPSNKYRLHPPYGLYYPFTTVETSRGCIARCNFCSYPNRPYRYRTAKNVVEEIELVVKDYGVKEIYFVDPIFTAEENRTIEICEGLLHKNIKVAWTCKERVDIISKKSLHLMRKAGCYMIAYGVESGAQIILDNLRKQIVIDKIVETFRFTYETGIRSIAYFMIGSPGDNYETIQETFRLLEKLDPDFLLFAGLTPDPGSLLYRKAISDNILSDKYYENLLFSDEVSEWPLYITPSLSRKEIVYWVKYANKKFYFRPKYWYKRFIHIKNFNDLRNMFLGIKLIILDMIFRKRDVVK